MSTHRNLLQILSSLVILTMLYSGFSLPAASAQGKSDGLKRQVNAQTGKVSFIGPESGRSFLAYKALGTFVRPQDPALALAKRFGFEFGLKNPELDLKEMKNKRAEDGSITARYQQEYEGIPIIGGELIVNTNDNSDLYSMNGEVSPNLSLSTQPTIDPEQAKQAALKAVAKWYQKGTEDFVTSEPELWIFDESLLRSSTRPAELVWRMEVTSKNREMPVRELMLINTLSGSISLHFNQVDTAWGGNIKEKVRPVLNTSSDSSTNPIDDPMSTQTGAIWYVATTGNDSNSCSSTGSPCATINKAMTWAAAGDTIKVAIGTYTNTASNVITVNKNITLSGGWNSSFATQNGMSTIDGQKARRGIYLSGGVIAVLDHFSIKNCLASGAAMGGGIYSDGNLTINNSLIESNSAVHGAGIYINSLADLTLNNTTLNSNSASNDGGGINSRGNITLNNSTLSHNSAAFGGGGIYNLSGTAVLNNSTLSSNSAYGGGGIDNEAGTLTLINTTVGNNMALSQGGGIYTFGGSASFANSILGGNTTVDLGPDCYGTILSSGYNLIGDNSSCMFSPATGDLVGTIINPIKPRLGPLQNNGGPTATHALMTGSPAIDAGNPVAPGSGNNTCLSIDQRGMARPNGIRCDIGAYEGSVPLIASALVNTFKFDPPHSVTFLCDQTQPNCTNGSNPRADSAHEHAIGTYNMFAAQFNRNSMDDHGLTIVSLVNYCDWDGLVCPYPNAFWSGTQIVYGDAHDYALADDVVAHEFTHGVTQYESNLFYYYQSGAINESFSDLWGEYYDQTNGQGKDTADVKWQIGEDASDPDLMRSMSDPSSFGDPDKVSSPNYYSGSGDNGGVHYNSGINNKAAYLMLEGGTFNNKTVSALGWVKTNAIYYEVNTNLLTSGADFSDLYYALPQACSNLIGQKGITAADCVEVKDAVDAVEMNGQPTLNFNIDAPLCTNEGTTASIKFADDFETGMADWTVTVGAGPRWQLDSRFGPYAESGLHSLYADDYPPAIDDHSAQWKSFFVPANAYLHFAQAYAFESSNHDYDGGVLEYSLNNGSNWVDAGSLIEVNKYTGTIYTGANNPLSGRSAFVGNSHGYISTRLNLASLAGKTISFRWRMGLDEANYAGGWWVDNIKVYSCIPAGPGAFNKLSPISSTGVDLSTTLWWTSSSHTTYYQYCYDIINDNQCNRTWSSSITVPFVNISNLGANATYYWQVRAVNGGNITEADNKSWGRFTTTSTLPAGTSAIETYVGVTQQGKYSMSSGQSLRESYTGVSNGPVKIISTNSVPLISAERVVYKVKNVQTSFTEMMGLPNSQLTTTYWLPWYNNVDLDTQLRFGNVSASTAHVHVYIGKDEMTGSPFTLQPGESARQSFAGINNGPVKIDSDQNIVAAERVIYKVNGTQTSFSEMMALPDSQLTTTYWLPWYNNVDLDTQLRFGNVSSNPATVHVYIGKDEMTGSPFTLAPGESTRQSFVGINNGPVKVKSDQNIVAAERVIYKVNGTPTSFTETMGLPDSQLSTTYWLPWYNNVDLDTQLRFGNVSIDPAMVHVYIGGTEVAGSPFTLQPGESTRQSFAGINNGPVKIDSDQNIVAAERVIYKVSNINTSFSEMMGLPNSQLNDTYWLPWYNNLDLDTQLRFGVP